MKESQRRGFGCAFVVSIFILGNYVVFAALWRVPPSPSLYWNQQLGGKSQFDPWAAISCGENLEPQ